jgi:hypothetical protein
LSVNTAPIIAIPSAQDRLNARSGNTVAMTWTLRSIATACGAAVPALAWKTGQLAVLTSAVF